jgi:hypothetical protein
MCQVSRVRVSSIGQVAVAVLFIFIISATSGVRAQGDFGDEVPREDSEQVDPDQVEVDSDQEQVEKDNPFMLSSKYGSIGFGFALQIGLDIFPNQVEGKRFGFSMHRARIRLFGHVIKEYLTYQITGDAISSVISPSGLGYPGGEILPYDSELDVPFLLDARVNWQISDIGITLSGGRFIPKWGLSMPEDITNLGAINYPLYVYGGQGSLGSFRTLGVEAEVELIPFLDIGGGIFNGGKNHWLDENDRKDILLFISTDFLPGLRIRASSMFAFPEQITEGDGDLAVIATGHETHILSVLEARYTDLGFDVMAGFGHGAIKKVEDAVSSDYDAFGFMVHLGYLVVGDWFQVMGRFERWEPSSEVANDEQLRFTVGPQFLLGGRNIRLNINFIQDLFAGSRAMCNSYLGLAECGGQELPDEARKEAAAILVQLTLAL